MGHAVKEQNLDRGRYISFFFFFFFWFFFHRFYNRYKEMGMEMEMWIERLPFSILPADWLSAILDVGKK